ncbi:hypothetical protein [Pseudarthrobacter equi]|uniref:hypothetical protein n=1 Tax=Pseudarthrobacter equi TaxID=728066 RepID=UPI0012FE10FD|nr:hypothetical protein [Pseudarthrobacter equi]
MAAEQYGVTKSTIKDWADKAGVRTVRTASTRAATEARAFDLKLKRQQAIELLMNEGLELLHDIRKPYKDVVVGGKDNVATEFMREKPSFVDRKNIMTASTTAFASAARLAAIDATTASDLTEKRKDLLTRMGEQLGFKPFEDDHIEEVPDVSFGDPSEATDGDLSETVGLPAELE